MTLQQLKYVIEVADVGSMSGAAKSLFISQPSMSSAISELENEIGISIFKRNNKGISITPLGEEFLGYARQVIEQTGLLEERYLNKSNTKQKFSVSAQHYSFVVNAFVSILKKYGFDEYDFTLRETRTSEIIDDVRNLKSELGILYLSNFNEKVIAKLINENQLEFHSLFIATPHIFISRKNPLSKKSRVKIEELYEYPRLSFEQGENNSFYFSEEMFSTIEHKKSIKVSDRATLFNLLIGMNGYTVSTGIISEELNGSDIVAVPIESDEKIEIGYITRKDIKRTEIGKQYVEELKKYIDKLS